MITYILRARFTFVVPIEKIAMPLPTPVVNKNPYFVSAEFGHNLFPLLYSGAGLVYCESSTKTVDK